MTESLIGLKVPNFSAECTNETTFRLEDEKGVNLVLYFYPKDDTPGCTSESQQFNGLVDAFHKLNCKIYGISKDSIASHKKFKSKYNFSFELLTDEDGKICEMFNVMKMKNMYGRQYLGIERSTFLINEKSEVIKEWRKVKVPGHADEVLQTLKKRE
tara:strand:+ start:219 stop:689 length:471 start_codon:yes stop_codon:yes gene_type:complete